MSMSMVLPLDYENDAVDSSILNLQLAAPRLRKHPRPRSFSGSSGVYIDGTRADVSPVVKQWANCGLGCSGLRKGEEFQRSSWCKKKFVSGSEDHDERQNALG